jgi:hypothetical protein
VERRLRQCSGVHPDEFILQARFRRAARHSAYVATSSPASTRARVVSQPHRKSPTTTQKIAAGTQAQWIRRRLPRWGRTPLIVPGGMAIGWPQGPASCRLMRATRLQVPSCALLVTRTQGKSQKSVARLGGRGAVGCEGRAAVRPGHDCAEVRPACVAWLDEQPKRPVAGECHALHACPTATAHAVDICVLADPRARGRRGVAGHGRPVKERFT